MSSLKSLLFGTISVVAASKLGALGNDESGDVVSHRNGAAGRGGRPFGASCFVDALVALALPLLLVFFVVRA